MPRRRRSNRRGQRSSVRGDGGSDVVTEKFNTQVTLFTGATSGSLVVNPANFGTYLAAMADLFTQFRFVRMRCGFISNVAGDSALGYKAGTTQTAGPSSLSTVMQLQKSAYNWSDQTTVSYLKLSRADLIGEAAMRWFKTSVGTDASDQGEQQGTLYGAAGGSATINLVIWGTIQFCGRIDPASNPVMLRAVDRLIHTVRETGEASGPLVDKLVYAFRALGLSSVNLDHGDVIMRTVLNSPSTPPIPIPVSGQVPCRCPCGNPHSCLKAAVHDKWAKKGNADTEAT